ncbi:MAG: hypothetical protein EPN97_02960 [Alphaproteobacteria bacterium]|nr:MAG: hypothetical protein EPN97_02960 [Alphaproteobacteria bacterium]
MKFNESGLPKDKLIEAAFDYSHAFTLKAQKIALQDFNRQMDEIHANLVADLDKEKEASRMPDGDYKRQKELLEKMHDDQLKQGPALVGQALEGMFVARRVNPALEMAKNSETPTAEMIAATLLCECIRSPKDFQTVTEKFGARVAGIAAEIAHIDAYPGERAENMVEASADAKRVYLAWLSSSTNNIAEQITRAAKERPEEKLLLPPGHEKQLYADVQPLWGVDKKLDARFFEVFNRVCEVSGSSFRLEADDKGGLNLVQGSLTPAGKNDGSKPKGPKGPGGGIGGDVF